MRHCPGAPSAKAGAPGSPSPGQPGGRSAPPYPAGAAAGGPVLPYFLFDILNLRVFLRKYGNWFLICLKYFEVTNKKYIFEDTKIL